MARMETVDIAGFFNMPYYESLDVSTTDYGEKELERVKAEIESDKGMKMAGAKTSNTTYILLGVAAVAVITLAVLKKKKIL